MAFVVRGNMASEKDEIVTCDAKRIGKVDVAARDNEGTGLV